MAFNHMIFLITAVAAAIMSACSKENPDGQSSSYAMRINAHADQITRTVLGEDSFVRWSKGDMIRVAYLQEDGLEAECDMTASSISDDGRAATFSASNIQKPSPTTNLYAVSPASASERMSYSGKGGTLAVPSVQEANASSFDPRACVATAYAEYYNENADVRFRNAVSLLTFNLNAGAEETVQTVKIMSHGEKLCGVVKYVITDDGVCQVTEVIDSSRTITIKGPFSNGEKYYACVLPTVVSGGLSIEFESVSGKKAEADVNGEFNFIRNGCYYLGSFDISEHWSENLWGSIWMDDWASSEWFGESKYCSDLLTYTTAAKQDESLSADIFAEKISDSRGFGICTNGSFSFKISSAGILEVSGRSSSPNPTRIKYQIGGGVTADMGEFEAASADKSSCTVISLALPESATGQTISFFPENSDRPVLYSIKYSGKAQKFLVESEDIDIDEETLNACRNFIASYVEENVTISPTANLTSSFSGDGSWSDIDYSDRSRSIWAPLEHLTRLDALAWHWYAEKDADARDCALKALDFWCTNTPRSDNWFQNQINGCLYLEYGVLLLFDALSAEQVDEALQTIETASVPLPGTNRSWLTMTGANRIWLSEVQLMRGLIKKDSRAVASVYNEGILGSVVVVKDGEQEGIQEDWSYHSHGPQLQMGTYGLSIANSFSLLSNAFKGTALEFTEEKRDIVESFVSNGLDWFDWRGYFDFSGCGRKVQKGIQKMNSKILSGVKTRLNMSASAPIGSKFFPRSDFAIYRTDKWYASVRMQSARTTGYEININGNNIKAYFTADGAMLPRISGDEYNDICPVWDWHHIPGVTAYDDGQALDNRTATLPYNKADNIMANSISDRFAVAMELDRDGLAAKKSWFFYNGGIVCLGAGISKDDASSRVTTSVNQVAKAADYESADHWVYNGKICYVPLDKSVFSSNNGKRTANFSDIGLTGGEVTADIVDLYIDHGCAPVNADYAYAVMMRGESADKAWSEASSFKVLENTATCQSAEIDGYVYTVDWGSNIITINKIRTGEQFSGVEDYTGEWIRD